MVTLQEISKILNSKGRFWIAFVGDSITSCEWVHPNWREIVEYVLKEELQKKFEDNWKIPSWGLRGFNFAYDGATTKDILEKVDDVKLIKPDLVILMIGGNDPSLGVSVEDHKANIKNIKSRLAVRFVFSTNNKPWNKDAAEKYSSYINVDKEIDMEDGQFINLFEISEKFPNEEIYTFKSEENPAENIKEGDLDYWHPNQLGNAFIAKIILKEVFGIEFDPEKYWQDTLAGQKYPNY